MRRGWVLTFVMVVGLGLGEGRPVKAIDPPACLWDPAPGVEAGPEAWKQGRACGEKVSALIRGGDDAERERFWSIFDELPQASRLRAPMIEAFLDWHLARALEDLAGASSSASSGPLPVPADVELPEHVKDAPAELQQAWRVFQQVTGNDEKARPRPAKGKGILFQSNQPAFQLATAASAGLASWMSRSEGAAPWDRRLLGSEGVSPYSEVRPRGVIGLRGLGEVFRVFIGPANPTTLPIGDLPVTSARITFTRLQHGRYSLMLEPPGTSVPAGPPVEVGDGPVTVSLSDTAQP